jgi:DNA-binding NarL/FixJ family response regulator/tetratricopeptide (TPR) repeat protein
VNPLVGREDELATALAAVRQAAENPPLATALVVDGDAGIGKTRLLTELSAAAQQAGFRTLVGHCVDLGDAPPPYLPFTEAFGRLAADEPSIGAALARDYPALSRLLPRGLSEQQPPALGEERVGRGALFESVLGALAFVAAEQPALLVIEDVHWADQATRDLLGFLFTRLSTERVAVVVSYRSDDLHRRHPLRPTLAQWARLPLVTRVHLDPLPADDIRELARAVGTGRLAEDELASIASRAEGNAFFAEELVAAAEQHYSTRELPWALADLMLVRLDPLSDRAREVVRVAAVAGRRVTHDLLEAVVDMPVGDLHAALREAVDAHLLEPTFSGRGYTFRHALLAEAVYDDLLPGERVRLHAAYAGVLAKSADGGSVDALGSAAELARHARASHDLLTAFDASRRAGNDAMAVAAPQEAMQHYEMALELAPSVPQGADDWAGLVICAVEAAIAAGHLSRGLKLARSHVAALADDAPDAVRARLLYAFALAEVAGETTDDALAATAEALRRTPAEPPTAFRAQLAALHALVTFILGRELEAERWARQAIAVAEQVGRRDAATDAQATLAMLERRLGDPEEAARLLERAAEDARAAGDVESELRSRHSLAGLYFEAGDLDRALEAYRDAIERARHTGRPWSAYGVNSRTMLAIALYTRGEWDDALREVQLTVGRRDAPPDDAATRLSVMALRVRAGRGDQTIVDEVRALRPWWERDGRVGLWGLFAAFEIYEQQGRGDEAIADIDELVAVLSSLWQNEWFLARIQLSAMAVAALATAAATAPVAERVALYDRGAQLVADGHTTVARGIAPGRTMGPEGKAWVARLEAEWARLRWLLGSDAPDADELRTLWQQTVDAFGYGNVVETTRAQVRLAGVLRATGHAAEAEQHARLAREAARRMGAIPLLHELGVAERDTAARTSGQPESLTAREREVLTLVAAGRTNRQIGQQLYISDKTVSVHVSNLLAKLGARSRTEAAAIARRDGLLPAGR